MGQAVGGILGAGASMGSGMMGKGAAQSASKDMAQSQMFAAILQMQMFQQMLTQLAPFRQYGLDAFGKLAPLIGIGEGGNPLTAPLTRPFQPTMEELEKTPGYKFSLDQGLKSVQNAYAAKGLGLSGSALRGAADYAQGLAANTYQQQFQNYWAQNKSIYDMLFGVGNMGANAASVMTQQYAPFAQMLGNTLGNIGNAQAYGQTYGAAAMGNGLTGAAQALGGIPWSSFNTMGKFFS